MENILTKAKSLELPKCILKSKRFHAIITIRGTEIVPLEIKKGIRKDGKRKTGIKSVKIKHSYFK